MAGKFGLSAGVSADSDEVKPNGEPCNMDKDEDMEVYMEMLEREKLERNTYTVLSLSRRRDPEVVERRFL